MQGFSVAQASRLAGCSQHQIRYWDQVSLVSPTGPVGTRSRRLYCFGDLVALKIVRSLLDGGMTLRQVRRAFDYLRESADLSDADAMSGVKLVTDGRSIFEICRTDGELLDALKSGQLALFVAVDEMNRSVDDEVRDFLEERQIFVDGLAAPHEDLGEVAP